MAQAIRPKIIITPRTPAKIYSSNFQSNSSASVEVLVVKLVVSKLVKAGVVVKIGFKLVVNLLAVVIFVVGKLFVVVVVSKVDCVVAATECVVVLNLVVVLPGSHLVVVSLVVDFVVIGFVVIGDVVKEVVGN